MGVVYAAEHPLLGSQAVVKQLRPELSAQRDVIERFFNEARAASRIKHPGIVSIFDFGYSEDGTAYFVMEYLEGESIGARLARTGPVAEAHAARLGRQMASALAAAHEAGIVHRDLKPDNVFLVPDEAVAGGERAKILDFGIAKLGGEVGEGVAVTRTGALLGSPLYMSPEQCRGTGEVDFRADVYALGCLLFAMVTGRPPFLGQGVGEIIGKHIYEQPPRPRELAADLSAGLDAAIMRALEKDPGRRHGSMRAFASALEGAATGGEAAVAALGAAADDSARFAATADTILSPSPEAAPTLPVVAAETPAAITGGSQAAPGRQRTVAMWIAAALAAGMAGFFVLARVDQKGETRGGAEPRTDTASPAATGPAASSKADTRQEPEPTGGMVPPPQGIPGNHATVTEQDQAAADAGVEELAKTVRPDAGPAKRKKSKLVRKPVKFQTPTNVDNNPSPPIKQQASDQDAPEETPPPQAAE